MCKLETTHETGNDQNDSCNGERHWEGGGRCNAINNNFKGQAVSAIRLVSSWTGCEADGVEVQVGRETYLADICTGAAIAILGGTWTAYSIDQNGCYRGTGVDACPVVDIGETGACCAVG